MRPGAPFAPAAVWQLAHAPEVWDVAISTVFPSKLTLAVKGDGIGEFVKKFPAAFVVIVAATVPFSSSSSTVAPASPLQFVSTFAAPITVPAAVNGGPSPLAVWQAMQSPPGCINGDPSSPSSHVLLLEQLAGVSLLSLQPVAVARPTATKAFNTRRLIART